LNAGEAQAQDDAGAFEEVEDTNTGVPEGETVRILLSKSQSSGRNR